MRHPKTWRPRASTRLALEHLEDRLLLATRFWTGAGPDSNWTDAVNWDLVRIGLGGPLLPLLPSPGDDLVFPADALRKDGQVNDFAGGTFFKSLNYEGSGYTVGGNSIALGSLTLNFTPSAGLALNAVVINAGLTFPRLAPAGLVNLAAPVTVTNAGTQFLLNGTVGGDADLQKRGLGELVFGGTNTFIGPMTVEAGTLTLRTTSALGSTEAGTTVNAGAELVLAGGLGMPPEPLTLGGTLRATGNTPRWTGTITLVGDAVIQVDGGEFSRLDLEGPVVDTVVVGGLGEVFGQAGGFAKRGGSRLFLHHTNGYYGGTVVAEGELLVTDPGALGAGSGTFPAGAGTTVLAGATLTVDGDFVVDEPLTLDGAAAGTAEATLRVTPGSDATWRGPVTLDGRARLFADDVLDPDGFAIPVPSRLTVSGKITGTGPLSVAATGSFVAFAGGDANDYLGGTSVTGNLELRKPSGTIAVPGTGPLLVNDGKVTLFPQTVGLVTIPFSGSNQVGSGAVVVLNRGTLDLNGNLNTVAGLSVVGSGVTTGAGTLTLNGPLTAASDADGHPALIDGRLSLGGATRAFTVNDGPGTPDLRVTAVVSGSNIGITKAGAGFLELDGDSTYSGTTTLIAGVAQVNGDQPNSNVVVRAGAELQGKGRVKGVTAQGGRVNPGALTVILTPLPRVITTAVLNTAGGVSFDAASTFRVDLNGPTAGSEYDQLNVTGAVSLGGATLDARLNYAPDAEALVILNNDGSDPIVGTFKDAAGNNLAEGSAVVLNGLTFRISYRGVDGTGNDVVLRRPSAPNFPPMIVDAALTPAIDEGDVATLSGQLVDPDLGDTITLTVSWGDGTPVETSHPGREPFAVTHRFLDDPPGSPDEYTVRFTWSDSAGNANSATRTITVRNLAPTVDAGDDVVLSEGQALVRFGSFEDLGVLDHWAATVDYGDGSRPQELRLLPGQQFVLQHHYDRPGRYRVTVTVRDDDGGRGAASFLATVAPRARGHDWDDPALIDALLIALAEQAERRGR
jgi:autotransporter-associated beta strand protein